uniref:Uncharacterized protein n=1 Tax=Monodelphis domestica TaxID=13616 RepID=A0A5F8G8X9_MONDO
RIPKHLRSLREHKCPQSRVSPIDSSPGSGELAGVLSSRRPRLPRPGQGGSWALWACCSAQMPQWPKHSTLKNEPAPSGSQPSPSLPLWCASQGKSHPRRPETNMAALRAGPQLPRLLHCPAPPPAYPTLKGFLSSVVGAHDVRAKSSRDGPPRGPRRPPELQRWASQRAEEAS